MNNLSNFNAILIDFNNRFEFTENRFRGEKLELFYSDLEYFQILSIIKPGNIKRMFSENYYTLNNEDFFHQIKPLEINLNQSISFFKKYLQDLIPTDIAGLIRIDLKNYALEHEYILKKLIPLENELKALESNLDSRVFYYDELIEITRLEQSISSLKSRTKPIRRSYEIQLKAYEERRKKNLKFLVIKFNDIFNFLQIIYKNLLSYNMLKSANNEAINKIVIDHYEPFLNEFFKSNLKKDLIYKLFNNCLDNEEIGLANGCREKFYYTLKKIRKFYLRDSTTLKEWEKEILDDLNIAEQRTYFDKKTYEFGKKHEKLISKINDITKFLEKAYLVP